MSPITFIDRPCGYGKSTQIIEMLSKNDDDNFLLIVPERNEIDRFLNAVNYWQDGEYVEKLFTPEKCDFSTMLL